MEALAQSSTALVTFMAECFWPGVTAQKVADAGERVQQASAANGSDHAFARYLGSIFVPTDEIALFLLEAASIHAATELAQQAAIPSERILEVVRLGAFAQPIARQRRFDGSSQ